MGHTHTAGIFLYEMNIQKYLIVRATNLNFWSIPKGIVEKKDENYLAAAFREFYEETGLDLQSLKLSNSIVKIITCEPVKYINNKKTLHSFMIIISNPSLENYPFECLSYIQNKPELGLECDKFEWHTEEHLKNILHYSQVVALNDAKTILTREQMQTFKQTGLNVVLQKKLKQLNND